MLFPTILSAVVSQLSSKTSKILLVKLVTASYPKHFKCRIAAKQNARDLPAASFSLAHNKLAKGRHTEIMRGTGGPPSAKRALKGNHLNVLYCCLFACSSTWSTKFTCPIKASKRSRLHSRSFWSQGETCFCSTQRPKIACLCPLKFQGGLKKCIKRITDS